MMKLELKMLVSYLWDGTPPYIYAMQRSSPLANVIYIYEYDDRFVCVLNMKPITVNC